MDQKVKRLLENKGNNYIFPFFYQLVKPPSTGRATAVIKEASSLKRKATAFAISRGSAIRRSG